jgi:NarL family two-component system response regulator LiaR
MVSGDSSVLVVDRNPVWLNVLAAALRRRGFLVVGTSSDPVAALALAAIDRPDVVLVDPQGEGLEWTTFVGRVRETTPATKVVAISESADQPFVESQFAQGASAFVLKTATEPDLEAALRVALSTAIHLRSSRLAIARVESAPAVAASLESDDAGQSLTRREREILGLVAEGMSNSAMAKKLWVTEQTVKFHLSNIYRKLDVANRTAAARWAQLHGVATVDADSALLATA